MGYVGQGDTTAHSSAGLVLDLNANMASGVGAGINPTTTVWQDLSGNSNNGTLTNFAYTTVSGWDGDGSSGDPYDLVFDGVDDNIIITDATSLNPTTEITLDIWCKFPANSPSGYLIAKNGYSEYCIKMIGSTIRFTCRGDADFAYTCTANTLYHFVATYKNGIGSTLYINNVNLGTNTTPTGAIVSSANPLTLGSYNTTSGYVKLAIYSTRIYNRAITTAEVSQNYNAGTAWNSTATNVTVSAVVATTTNQAIVSVVALTSNNTIASVSATSINSAIVPAVSITGNPTIVSVGAKTVSSAVAPTINAIRNAIISGGAGITTTQSIVPTVTTGVVISATINAVVATTISQAVSPTVQTTVNAVITAVVATLTTQARSPTTYSVTNVVVNAVCAITTTHAIVPTVLIKIKQHILKAAAYLITRNTTTSIRTRTTKTEVLF